MIAIAQMLDPDDAPVAAPFDDFEIFRCSVRTPIVVAALRRLHFREAIARNQIDPRLAQAGGHMDIAGFS